MNKKLLSTYNYLNKKQSGKGECYATRFADFASLLRLRFGLQPVYIIYFSLQELTDLRAKVVYSSETRDEEGLAIMAFHK